MTNHALKNESVKPSSASELLDLIGAELRKLSKEIESLPSLGDAQLTNEQIVQLQKIDFCSQRMMDLAALAERLSTDQDLDHIKFTEDLSESVTLEYTKALLQ